MIFSPYMAARKALGRASFRWKAILFIASIEGLFNIAFAIVIVSVMTANLEEQFRKRATITAQLFATSMENAVLTTDMATLESFADKVIQNPDLLYAAVFDSSGILVKRTRPETAAPHVFRPDTNLSEVDDGIFDTFSDITIDGISYGRVEIGLTTDLLGATISAIKTKVILIGLGEIVVSGFVSFLLGTFLVRRLVALEAAAREIADGQYGTQVPVSGEDELARTALAFNRMSHTTAEAIDALKERNQELLAKRNRIRAVLDTALHGVIVIDSAGTIESFNPAAEKIFGYGSDDVVGRGVTLLMPDPYHAQHPSSVAAYLAGQGAKIIGIGREAMGRRKNGDVFPLELAVSELETTDGIRRFVGVVADISARKEAEAAANAAREEAERARSAAERANHAKSVFLANMSHELKTPLAAILRRLEMFAKQFRSFPSMREIRQVLEEVQDGEMSAQEALPRLETAVEALVGDVKAKSDNGIASVHHLQTIIGDILDFAKLEAGKLRVTPTRLDVEAVVMGVLPSIKPLAAKRGLDVTIDVAPTLQARADGDRLSQIILNLLSNAVKFTESGGHVHLEARGEGDWIRISVRDTGIGIAPEHLGTIFGAFEQVEDTLVRRSGGTGLGLPIAKQLLAMMTGDITVESTLGVGSLFTITLPKDSGEQGETP